MSNARRDTEVCVVGGGPAGATFAKRLAELGHQVVLVERAMFPRPHVGEALTPEIWPLLEHVGVAEAVRRSGFVHGRASRVQWVDGEPRVSESGRDEDGITVDRGRFDQIVLDHARATGVNVLEPAVANRPVRTHDGWAIDVVFPEGPAVVHAAYLADATGRSFLSGGRKLRRSPRTLALHASWRLPRARELETRVVAIARGWLWAAQLPDGRVSAMAFVDPAVLRGDTAVRGSPGSLYKMLIDEGGLSQELEGAVIEGHVHVCDASTYSDPEPIDERSVKLGEAAFGIDPLSSSGVRAAMQSAIAGSVAAHTTLSPDGDTTAAMAFYREGQEQAVGRHLGWAARFYAEHELYRSEPFWRRRAADVGSSPAARRPEALRELWDRRVGLADHAELALVPCAVDDRVELRRALTSRSLPGPVAYLDRVEIAPLVDGLARAASLNEAVGQWALRMPLERAVAIARWLAGRGLIAPAGGSVPAEARQGPRRPSTPV